MNKSSSPRQQNKFSVGKAIRLIRQQANQWRVPYLSKDHVRSDPFRTLVACILSLRTQDATTEAASERLFARADTPRTVRVLGARAIARLIYPVGFYNQKSRQIMALCSQLLNNFGGAVPDDIDALLTLDGVGRKTANLVVTEAFRKPGICVDTHVHRITNRWGYVRTKTPNETETALRRKLPHAYWLDINRLLVTYGQRRCTPISPKCSECPLIAMCAQRGVKKAR